MTPASPKKARTLSCTPQEQAMIRRMARKSGKSRSRYLLDLVRADDPEGRSPAPSAAERAELLDGVAEIRALARALRRELPGGSGLSLMEAIEVLAHAAREPGR